MKLSERSLRRKSAPEDQRPSPARIVIVGGGIAGLRLAARLSRTHRRSGAATVTLVDRGLSHVWKPNLHTFAAGTRRPARQRADHLTLANRHGYRFWPGVLVGVDRDLRRVRLAPDHALAPALSSTTPDELEYDVLIVAVGSQSNDFGTTGVAEHCLTVDDVAGAELFRSHLRRHVFTSLLSGGPIEVAIVGGGPTGIELAAELKQALDWVASAGDPSLTRDIRLTLLDHGARVLGTFPEAIAQAATSTLTKLGVTVRTGVAVVAADSKGFVLDGGERVDAVLRVWAAGVKAPDVLATIDGLERSRSGQLVVTPTLQTTVDPNIFAIGDCAALDVGSGHHLPATAQVAHEQAGHLGRRLDPRHLERMEPFRYRDFGSIVALGDYAGWGAVGKFTFGGGRVQGLSARWAHELLYRQHQLELHGPLRGALAWLIDWLDGYVSSHVQLDS